MVIRHDRRRAFEREVLPHLDAAYRLAWALTGRQQDAEDLVQDAVLRAFTGFDGYQAGTNARAWLLTILRRTFLNDRRHARAAPPTIDLGAAGRDGEPLDPPDLDSLGPEALAVQAAERAAVLAALAELPEGYRAVLALVDLEGLRYAEAATILECPLGTVMSRLHRGRHALADRLRTSMGWAVDTDAEAQPEHSLARSGVLALAAGGKTHA